MSQYQFPHITNIDDVLEAIAGREEFVVKHDADNGYRVINYLVNFEDTFPAVTDRRTALLRECRGITFCDATGVVLSRKFHKFFNVGEKHETLEHNVDFTRPHKLLEKLDGSMITFLVLKDGSLRACTKMGLTDIAKQPDGFIATHPEYEAFIRDQITAGKTPMFEWCSRQQRIVIDYMVERLVLTAIRDNVTGDYESFDDLQKHRALGIDVVGLHSGDIVDGEEGYIVAFDDGHKLKVKGAWYVQLHKTLDHLKHEKDVIRLILDDKLDDAKPFLPEDLMSKADDFAKQIFENIRKNASDLFWEVQAAHDNLNGGKKRFADIVNAHPRKGDSGLVPALFKIWDFLDQGEDYAYEYLKDLLGKNVGTQNKVNTMRWLIGEKTWRQYDILAVEE